MGRGTDRDVAQFWGDGNLLYDCGGNTGVYTVVKTYILKMGTF